MNEKKIPKKKALKTENKKCSKDCILTRFLLDVVPHFFCQWHEINRLDSFYGRSNKTLH